MTSGTQTPRQPTVPDELLVSQAQAGAPQAAEQLLQRFRPAVRARASRYTGVSLETEDLAQEGMLALFSAIYAYKGDRNTSFRTFAAVCVENRLRSVVKENASLKNSPLNTYVPLDTLEIADDGDPVHIIISDETTSEWFHMFENDLSSLEHSVLKCFLKGYSYREIADILGITEKAADNALQRIRSKVKKKRETL